MDTDGRTAFLETTSCCPSAGPVSGPATPSGEHPRDQRGSARPPGVLLEGQSIPLCWRCRTGSLVGPTAVPGNGSEFRPWGRQVRVPIPALLPKAWWPG